MNIIKTVGDFMVPRLKFLADRYESLVAQEDTYNIVERSLWEFLCEMQNGIKQGYVLSDENKHFPQGHISLYTATLVKESKNFTCILE